MKNYALPVAWVTGFLLIFVTLTQLQANTALILFLFSISPILVIWMVYKVLVADVTVDKTFDEQWYCDREN
ncbi:hypothetical protein [Pararhodonellum marinum]|uniref:hypothetical protein n=1 Tax=Pararhodonellum marinum TaxID=2755358 RepID=UPI00188FEB56|nr:hypothetical protein [Pararhodonellum marinum]